MALFQLIQANAFVVDLGAHRVKLGLAHDVGPTLTLPFLPGYRTEPERLAQRIFDAYKAHYAVFAAEPQPVFLAVDQDVRASFLFRLADALLSVFPGVVFHSALSCALYSTGRLTCLLLDAGHRALRVASFVDGVVLEVVRETRFSGEAFEHELLRLVEKEKAESFEASSSDVLDVLDTIKREYLAASLDPVRDAALARSTDLYRAAFRLPCGHELVLNAEKHGLFEDLYGRAGLLDTVVAALSARALPAAAPVVLTGGLSALSNFGRRLLKDLKTTTTTTTTTTVYGSQDAANAVWQGAAAFVGVGILQDAMITRRALDEEGAHFLARVVV